MFQIFFAILAGILTIGSPCVLPILPILLGASAGRESKTRPLFIALGFTITFSLAALFLSYIVIHLHIAPDLLRNIAVVLLAIFGLFMLWPKPFELLTLHLSKYINSASQTAQSAGSGNFGGLVLGAILGLIWTPCAGPVLGTILTLIATQEDTARAAILLISYSIGAGIPMLLIAYGGQYVTTRVRFINRYTTRIQQIFGVLILALAILMYFGYDTKLQAQLLDLLPGWNFAESNIFK